jgi:peptidoglycan glycosyltransferase
VIPQLRKVAIGMFVLFGALFLNLNYLQVLRADDLANDNRNARGLIREYEVRRGLILAADGSSELARVEPTDGTLRFERRYADGPLYAHVTGYHSVVFGRSEVEQAANDFLIGAAPETFGRNLADLLAGRERTGDDAITTIVPQVQAAARDALGDRRGAVVAIAPRTGDILALWSAPTYDPNQLATHDRSAANAYWAELNEDPGRPLINRAVREWYPPGSTFKLVTAAAALEGGLATPDTTFDDPVEQPLPQTTSVIRNFGRGTCAGGGSITLSEAMVVSCNTTFAQLGLELGDEALADMAEAFGLNSRLIGADQVPSPLESRMPRDLNPPQTAQSAIGQFDVRTTPLQMAMIAATIGNEGRSMTPHLVRAIQDERAAELVTYEPEPFVPDGRGDNQVISQQTAAQLRDMMVRVVQSGTGRNAAIGGVTVAGKTGTAETGGPPTVWFAGFAPAEDPQVAVAIVVEEGGGVGDEATGGAVAAPIARAVMEAALAAGPIR